jgi:hypothetical protein
MPGPAVLGGLSHHIGLVGPALGTVCTDPRDVEAPVPDSREGHGDYLDPLVPGRGVTAPPSKGRRARSAPPPRGDGADGPMSGTSVRYPAQRQRKSARTGRGFARGPLGSTRTPPPLSADCRHPLAATAGTRTSRAAEEAPAAELSCSPGTSAARAVWQASAASGTRGGQRAAS